MQDQPDLFSFANAARYPQVPGYKRRSTSRDAARAMRARAPTLRESTLEIIRISAFGMTADEVATALQRSILSIRPRVSELAAVGLIYETRERRDNASGVKAIVWRAREI